MEYNVYDLADMLANEIEKSGKTRWSAKDVKQTFLNKGIDLSLDEILQVWDACPSQVCACELMGCDEVVMAEDDLYTHPKDIVSVELSDGSENGKCADTFYMKAYTRDGEVITIEASDYSTCRYDATYKLKSSDIRKAYSQAKANSIGMAAGQLETVVDCFFNKYRVPEDLKQEIDNFVNNYY